jgi:hypothetical protein
MVSIQFLNLLLFKPGIKLSSVSYLSQHFDPFLMGINPHPSKIS